MISSKKICALLLVSSCISNVSCDRTAEWRKTVAQVQHQIEQEQRQRKQEKDLRATRIQDAEGKIKAAIASGDLKRCSHQFCIEGAARQHVAAQTKKPNSKL